MSGSPDEDEGVVNVDKSLKSLLGFWQSVKSFFSIKSHMMDIELNIGLLCTITAVAYQSSFTEQFW